MWAENADSSAGPHRRDRLWTPRRPGVESQVAHPARGARTGLRATGIGGWPFPTPRRPRAHVVMLTCGALRRGF
jgi:hypothetical protein